MNGLSNAQTVTSNSGGMELLWTNPDTTKEMPDYTQIALDISPYKYLVFFTRESTSDTSIPASATMLSPKDIGYKIIYSDDSSYYRQIYGYNEYGNPKTLQFGRGFFNGSTNNTAAIPYQIYGIR